GVIVSPSPLPAASDAASAGTRPGETEPAAVSEDGTAAAGVAEEHGEPFCAQRGSRLFHRRECAWTPRIREVDRVYFKQLSEAREQGFSTCPVCEPWEPT
ncbi:MAG: hypothetical protein ACREJG_06545, partial [Candidatus Rokuibacteriota bacterium]